MEYVEKITREEIRSSMEEYITEGTGHSVDFATIEEAIEASVKSIYQRVNDFEVLTQEMIDDQAEDYDGYLDGAEVGELVWGDNEMWVSQGTVESWIYEEEGLAHGKDLDVRDIESLVADHLIVDRLKKFNSK
ncbi:hypothetical protein C1M56_03085 [Vibrio diazotrophicus]|nr:hypothetical protein C1M56_03085 [Vibrio diazotrophicus]